MQHCVAIWHCCRNGALGALLLAWCMGAGGAEPQFVVSSTAIQSAGIKIPTGQEIVDQLAAQKWCRATAKDNKQDWQEPPAGVPREQWLSVVTIGFNEQADGYAFQFAGPDGAMSLAAHVPFRKTWMPNNTLVWVWPFDSLLGAVRVQQAAAPEATARKAADPAAKHRPLSLQVIPWQGSSGPSAKPNKSSLSEARAVDPQLTLAAIQVMAPAAAFEAGFAPTPGKAEWSATCEVRAEDQGCSLRLTLRGPGGERSIEKLGVSWEAYHDHLLRMFRHVQPGSGVSDFVQLARGSVLPIAVREQQLATLVDKELVVFDLATGKRQWTTDPPSKPRTYRPTDQYAARATPAGDVLLVGYRGALGELAWASGERKPLAPLSPDRTDGWSADPGEVAVASAGAVKLCRPGQVLWEHKALGVTVGPLLSEDAVVFGDNSGSVTALNRKDGSVRAQGNAAAGLQGSIVVAGDSLLVFSNTAESLIALDRAKLRERWRQKVGDALLQPPLVIGEQLLVATKGNRLLLLDAKTGAVQKEVRWPTWLVGVTLCAQASPTLVAVTDLAGKVTLLSLGDLKPMRELPLEADLVGAPLLAAQLASVWPVARPASGEEDLVDELGGAAKHVGATLLVADKQGFVYLLPLARKE